MAGRPWSLEDPPLAQELLGSGDDRRIALTRLEGGLLDGINVRADEVAVTELDQSLRQVSRIRAHWDVAVGSSFDRDIASVGAGVETFADFSDIQLMDFACHVGSFPLRVFEPFAVEAILVKGQREDRPVYLGFRLIEELRHFVTGHRFRDDHPIDHEGSGRDVGSPWRDIQRVVPVVVFWLCLHRFDDCRWCCRRRGFY